MKYAGKKKELLVDIEQGVVFFTANNLNQLWIQDLHKRVYS